MQKVIDDFEKRVPAVDNYFRYLKHRRKPGALLTLPQSLPVLKKINPSNPERSCTYFCQSTEIYHQIEPDGSCYEIWLRTGKK